LQAAVLRRKLAYLDSRNEGRRQAGAALRALLTGSAGAVQPPGRATDPAGRLGRAVDPVQLPFAEADHVYHLFVVRCAERDALREHLTREGVASAIHYPVPIHRTGAYAELGLQAGSLPVSEALAGQICSLPVFPGMSEAELEQVAKAVHSFTKDAPVGER
jgi:dTDP-3-amino-3,4,6-trideoxy-alpha-D-glucose transaminase